LLQIVETRDALGLLSRRCQRRQQERRKNGDDGNDHQQLDQCKSSPRF